MYTHCIFCKAELGRNQVIERFPIGRRLAFDGEKGRFWVVCKRCTRWSLTPLEERWEAIKECERRFRATRARLSTENIGLARLPDGTDIIRVGRPLRPELAAWRNGQTLVNRRHRELVVGGVFIGAIAGLMVGGPLVLGILGGSSGMLVQVANWANIYRVNMRTVARLAATNGRILKINQGLAHRVTLHADGQRWYLTVPYSHGAIEHGALEFRDEEAVRMAAMLLPHINRRGAKRDEVQGAVRQLEDSLTPMHYFALAARQIQHQRPPRLGGPMIAHAPSEIRIALEMAAHEEQERRALEGELSQLEAMWREAEEIASISDNLLLPRSVSDFIKRQKSESNA